jgi:pilus assembly protein CpaB
MNRKAAIPLVLGLVIGLVAVKLVMDSVKRAQGSNQAQQKFAVVQARTDIGAYEEISPEMVQAIEIGESALAPPQERIAGVELAVGRVTAKPIPQNAPVLKSMLAPEGTKPRMVGRIPPGFRAVSVKIDEVTGVAYQMQAGDWVDVIVVMDLESGSSAKRETIAEVILQHVQVAAVGRGSSNEAESAGGKGTVKPAQSVTLLVKEEDVPKLHLAATRGKITLAMRGEDDKTTEQPVVAYSSEIGTQGTIVEPAPVLPKAVEAAFQPRPVQVAEAPQPLPHTVAVYRGTSLGNQPAPVERITFESNKSPKILEVTFGPPTRASATMSLPRGRTHTPPATPPAANNETPPDFPSSEDFDVTEDSHKSQTGGE